MKPRSTTLRRSNGARRSTVSRRGHAAGAALGLVALATACAGNRPEPFEGSPSRGQMISHFDLAVEARGHVIMGEVGAFRDAVSALSDLEPADDLDATIILQLGPMRWEAREAAMARTVEEAAQGAAKIAATCGECHVANGDPLADRFTIGGPPPPGTAARHMAGLAWASRLLWDGVIGPSDRMWVAGAEGLVELGALPEGLPADLPAGDVRIAGVRLQQLGGRAALLRDTEERIDILAEIWTVCATCHTGG